MEDGAEKKRKQIELDYQKEYTEIQKLEREWLAKNGENLHKNNLLKFQDDIPMLKVNMIKVFLELEGGFYS